MEIFLSQLGINTEQLYAIPTQDRKETQAILNYIHRT